MKDKKSERQKEKRNSVKPMHPFSPKENEQELYLEHLMQMMVNVLDRGLQKN